MDVHCSCCSMGSWKAISDRRSGSGTTVGHAGSSQDPLHLPLPHRCLFLGSQGNHILIIYIYVCVCVCVCVCDLCVCIEKHYSSDYLFYVLDILKPIDFRICRHKLHCFLAYLVMKLAGKDISRKEIRFRTYQLQSNGFNCVSVPFIYN